MGRYEASIFQDGYERRRYMILHSVNEFRTVFILVATGYFSRLGKNHCMV